EEADAHRIMDRALEHSINFFDTANVYGGGSTEEIIGRWFAQGGGRREKTVIATKVYGGRDPWPNTNRLSALHIRQACEDSLRRLQTDHIDLYQMHHVDRDTPWDEIWQAMDLLVSQGKVIYVGSSNFAGWHIAKANEAARQRSSLGLVSEQSLYNLTARMVELEVVPACEGYGLGLIPWSPLGGGLLGGALARDGVRRASDRVQERVDSMRPQLERYEKLCAELGEQPADVALAWLLANPVVTAPIIGPRTTEQLDGSLRALDITLTDEVLADLDAIFPGPGGTAPEAYAW
ncbi:MAG TPA: aldo/keto reductase, partial [Acidimicrobiales bacterium]|nr:aldo/keto reductase [Acidimicrobiales bacterium]